MTNDGVTFTNKEYLVRIEAKVDHLAAELALGLGDMRRSQAAMELKYVQLEAKMHELDRYGSREVQSLIDRVVKLETESITKREVGEVIQEREKKQRESGGHRLQYAGFAVAAVGLLVTIIWLVVTVQSAPS